MKKIWKILFAALLVMQLAACTTPKTNTIKNEEITFSSIRETKIHASISLPNQKNDIPLVIMLHGFKSSSGGRNNFEPLAKELAENGIASIRIDFPGNGESEEDYTAYDLTNMSNDIDAAIAYMKKEYSIDEKKIGMVGHSMGGRITSLYLNDDIAAAALWAPAANNGLAGLADFMGGEQAVNSLYSEAKENGFAVYKNWGEPFVNCSYKFFEENEMSKPLDSISQYTGDLFIAVAENDYYVSKETTNAVIQAAKNIQVVNIKNADHVFKAADGSSSTLARETLVNETAKFLKESLK